MRPAPCLLMGGRGLGGGPAYLQDCEGACGPHPRAIPRKYLKPTQNSDKSGTSTSETAPPSSPASAMATPAPGGARSTSPMDTGAVPAVSQSTAALAAASGSPSAATAASSTTTATTTATTATAADVSENACAWRESLEACQSMSCVFLHLYVLDASVAWSKSVQKARCKVCRKGGDSERMLLCDKCDGGYHMFCLKQADRGARGRVVLCALQPMPATPKRKLRSRVVESDEESELVEADENFEEEDEEEEDGGGWRWLRCVLQEHGPWPDDPVRRLRPRLPPVLPAPLPQRRVQGRVHLPHVQAKLRQEEERARACGRTAQDEEAPRARL